MEKINPIIMLFLLLLLNNCGQIRATPTISIENYNKSESIISLGLSTLKVDLILNSFNIHPAAFAFGDTGDRRANLYHLQNGKVLYLDYKYSENGLNVCDISVSSKVLPIMVGKADPEMNAFWGSFKTVKAFNVKTMN